MILCPYEKIISKSEADFDTQWGGKRRAIWKAQSLRSFPFQIAFSAPEGLRSVDFIIVGGMIYGSVRFRKEEDGREREQLLCCIQCGQKQHMLLRLRCCDGCSFLLLRFQRG